MNLQSQTAQSPGRPHSVYKDRGSSEIVGWPPSLEGYSLLMHFLPMGLGEDRLCWARRTVFDPKIFHRTHPVSGTARPSRRRAPVGSKRTAANSGVSPFCDESRGDNKSLQRVTQRPVDCGRDRCAGVYWCAWVVGSLSGISRPFPISGALRLPTGLRARAIRKSARRSGL